MASSIRSAILQAAENVGAKKSRRKQNGLISFFEHLAETHPREFVKLLTHVLRQPDEPREDAAPHQTVEELQKLLRARGLPEQIYSRVDFAKKR